MPMCDIFIPEGAIEPAAERALVATVSSRIVEHEIRRFAELEGAPETAMLRERAESIAWMFMHRPAAVYVAGERAPAPIYKFVITIPKGTIDDRFAPAITRDIFEAVRVAEGGRERALARRLWVFIEEIADGRWGAGDRPMRLTDITRFVRGDAEARA